MYSVHAPEAECLAKRKVVKRYEFGVNVSITVTKRSKFVFGGMALSGNLYDGHTLKGTLEQVFILSIALVFDQFYNCNTMFQIFVYLSDRNTGIFSVCD